MPHEHRASRQDAQEGAGEVPAPAEREEERASRRISRRRATPRRRRREESTQDIADKAVSSYTREFLYSLSDNDRKTLLQIDQALGADRRRHLRQPA